MTLHHNQHQTYQHTQMEIGNPKKTETAEFNLLFNVYSWLASQQCSVVSPRSDQVKR